jgi:hypothetical protein
MAVVIHCQQGAEHIAMCDPLDITVTPHVSACALPVPSKDTVYWDAGTPGFGVKVTPRGRKVFLVMYRVAGAGSRLRKYTIGPHGRITLPDGTGPGAKDLCR